MVNFGKLSIDDIELQGKRVLMRVDYNVPLNPSGKIKNDLRIRGSLPTIRKVLKEGGSLVLMSHLGRPKENGFERAFSLRPVASKLEELLEGEAEVIFAEDCMNAGGHAASLKPGQILLLENLRFYRNESSKNQTERHEMARVLSSYGDIFVSDAFGTAHRNAASMTGIPEILGQGACGYLMKTEIDYFSNALSNPARPFCAIVGGAKVSDKILLLDNLIDMVDKLLIGGAMAYTFLKSQGWHMGKSKCETTSKSKKGDIINATDLAARLIRKAEKKGVRLVLPIDHRCAESFRDVPPICTETADIPSNLMALDLGPKSEKLFSDEIASCRTAVWNGPVGVFEMKNFRSGTWAVARTLAETPNMLSVVGGGDSASAAEKSGYASKISHISTGGGAALELLEGKILPGLKALTPKDVKSETPSPKL